MPVQGRVPKPWSIADAFETYGIRDWGKHYFHISDAGHVLVTPPVSKAIALISRNWWTKCASAG